MKNVVVIGAGPAGMTAALYLSDAGVGVTLIEKGMYGGQMTTTARIANYPGFVDVAGWELSQHMFDQLAAAGVTITADTVTGIEKSGEGFTVKGINGSFSGDAVIIANGVTRRRIGCPGETEFAGRGVSYCAVCDGNFFRGRDVAVIGGGNSALEDAAYLAGICPNVYLIHRRDELRADEKYVRAAKSKENITFVYSHYPERIIGDDRVSGIEIRDLKTGEIKTLDVSGVFVAVGLDADNGGFGSLVDLTENGYIDADESCVTSCPGIFAAGDTRDKKLRQIVTATADGAVAAKQAIEYLNG